MEVRSELAARRAVDWGIANSSDLCHTGDVLSELLSILFLLRAFHAPAVTRTLFDYEQLFLLCIKHDSV